MMIILNNAQHKVFGACMKFLVISQLSPDQLEGMEDENEDFSAAMNAAIPDWVEKEPDTIEMLEACLKFLALSEMTPAEYARVEIDNQSLLDAIESAILHRAMKLAAQARGLNHKSRQRSPALQHPESTIIAGITTALSLAGLEWKVSWDEDTDSYTLGEKHDLFPADSGEWEISWVEETSGGRDTPPDLVFYSIGNADSWQGAVDAVIENWRAVLDADRLAYPDPPPDEFLDLLGDEGEEYHLTYRAE